jgi:hypothetical protein
MNNTLPIDPEEIHTELEQIERIATKWRTSVGNGIAGIDLPTADAEEKLDAFLRQFTGELLFLAGKCQNLAVVLSER